MEDEIVEETELQKKIRKITKAVIALFLILMMLSFIIPGDVIQSLLVSSKIENNMVVFQNKTIIFSNFDELKMYYLHNQMTEFELCLTGEIRNNTYFVDSFYSPRIFFKTPVSVASERCNEKTIISLHSHPFNNCLFSEQDILSYKNEMIGIMCSIDRFSFYGNEIFINQFIT